MLRPPYANVISVPHGAVLWATPSCVAPEHAAARQPEAVVGEDRRHAHLDPRLRLERPRQQPREVRGRGAQRLLALVALDGRHLFELHADFRVRGRARGRPEGCGDGVCGRHRAMRRTRGAGSGRCRCRRAGARRSLARRAARRRCGRGRGGRFGPCGAGWRRRVAGGAGRLLAARGPLAAAAPREQGAEQRERSSRAGNSLVAGGRSHRRLWARPRRAPAVASRRGRMPHVKAKGPGRPGPFGTRLLGSMIRGAPRGARSRKASGTRLREAGGPGVYAP